MRALFGIDAVRQEEQIVAKQSKIANPSILEERVMCGTPV
jgi:hypothetical protein